MENSPGHSTVICVCVGIGLLEKPEEWRLGLESGEGLSFWLCQYPGTGLSGLVLEVKPEPIVAVLPVTARFNK